MFNERARVQKLTNRELVTEALHADDTDTPVINEMMDRLDPGWYERESEPPAVAGGRTGMMKFE